MTPDHAPQNEATEKIAAGIRELAAGIERMKAAASRVETADRIGFENQIDVLVQRQRTLAERLKLMLETADRSAREDLQRSLADELDELRTSVRQVDENIAQH